MLLLASYFVFQVINSLHHFTLYQEQAIALNYEEMADFGCMNYPVEFLKVILYQITPLHNEEQPEEKDIQ